MIWAERGTGQPTVSPPSPGWRKSVRCASSPCCCRRVKYLVFAFKIQGPCSKERWVWMDGLGEGWGVWKCKGGGGSRIGGEEHRVTNVRLIIEIARQIRGTSRIRGGAPHDSPHAKYSFFFLLSMRRRALVCVCELLPDRDGKHEWCRVSPTESSCSYWNFKKNKYIKNE